MTDTPPSEPVFYVPGRLGQEPLDATAPAPALQPPPAGVPTPSSSATPLLVGGLVALVLALGGAVAVLALRDPGGTPAAASASPSPSWKSVFGDQPTTVYSPPPPREISVQFGETLTLTSTGGDEVHYTVTADRTYAKTKYGTKPKKGVLYGVKVTIEVIDGSVYAYAGDFALVSADGTVYEGSGYEIEGGLDGVELNRKQKATGVVVFDCPATAPKGARIELREGSKNQGFWEVP